MKAFAELYSCLDETTRTNRKLACMEAYFRNTPAADAAWAVYFLSGRKPKGLVRTKELREWCTEASGCPEWLFDESHDAVGDLAETIALLLPAPQEASTAPLSHWVEKRMLPLRDATLEERREAMLAAWRELDSKQRLVWNKLLTGSFRVGVSRTLVIRALAAVAGVAPAVIAHRLMGEWTPTVNFFESLIAQEESDADLSRPFPFCLAHPLEADPQTLGRLDDWLVEWKWDGIRAQIVRREGHTSIWSRGEELVTDRFPELLGDAAQLADGTVLDGEILAWNEQGVMPFGALQRRIGRKTLGAKILRDVPVRFVAFDLLEHEGADIRFLPLAERRARLEEALVKFREHSTIAISPVERAESWEALARRREESRLRNVEGLMIKRRESAYMAGRVRGAWWKWKISPHTVDAVLVYAQRGHGRRAGLYTDYTFAVWDQGELVPFAKAYSGLTDDEIRQVDRFIRQNTIEKFGPVRRVKPELVFEMAFENIQLSTRHKSGVAVRFPRMVRWRTDKTAAEADTIDSIKALLK